MQVALAEIRGTAFGLPVAVRASGSVAASAIPGLLYIVASPIVGFIDLVACRVPQLGHGI